MAQAEQMQSALCTHATQALRAAARWPLDNDVLPQLYLSLLQCLLREQVRRLLQQHNPAA
jgi:hypothetical protein